MHNDRGSIKALKLKDFAKHLTCGYKIHIFSKDYPPEPAQQFRLLLLKPDG